MTISGNKSRTDWECVRKSIELDEPIPYDPNDPDDGPYDPNDDAAVEAYFKNATIWSGWPNPVMIQKDGVPIPRSEQVPDETTFPRAKAS